MLQKGTKIAFMAIGVMVFEAWKAAKILEEQYGIIPYVIDMVSVKPLDEEMIIKVAKEVDTIFTFEEHNILAGFGSAIAEVVTENQPVRVLRVGLKDEFGQSGTADALMNHYNLTAEKIVTFIKKNI